MLTEARRLALRVALLGLPVGAGLAAWHFGASAWGLAAALASASALAVLQQQWRALVLLGPVTWRFNLVTVAPQVLLLPLAAGVVLAGGAAAGALAWGLAALWLLAAAYAGQTARRTPAPARLGALAPRSQLLRHGGASWATVSFAALGIVVLQSLAQRRGGHRPGWASSAWPCSCPAAADTVELRAARCCCATACRTPRSRLRLRASLVAAACPCSCWPPPWPGGWGVGRSDLWMGAGYEGLHLLVAWLLVAGAAEAATRLALVHAQAEDRPGPRPP